MNRQMSLQERMEDAMFALLLSNIAEQQGQEYLSLAEQLNADSSASVPAKLDRNCKQLIQNNLRKIRNQHTGRKTAKVLRRALIVAVAAALLIAVAYAAIPNFRVGVLNLVLTITDEYTGLGFQVEDPNPSVTENSISESDILYQYSLPIIPDGYEPILCVEDDRSRAYFYENTEEEMIVIHIMLGTTGTIYSVDTENAQVVEDISINGYDGIYVEKDGTRHVVWADTDRSVFLDVLVENAEEIDIMELAKALRYTPESTEFDLSHYSMPEIPEG